MSGFDYPYTCPGLDDRLSGIVGSIADLVTDESLVEQLKEDIEAEINSIRDINSAMREAAEKQITDLEEKLQNLEVEYENLEEDFRSTIE